jgi:hypothetical protein
MENQWIDNNEKPEMKIAVMIKIRNDNKKRDEYLKNTISKVFNIPLPEEIIMIATWDIPEWSGYILNDGKPMWCCDIAINPAFQTVIAWKYN